MPTLALLRPALRTVAQISLAFTGFFPSITFMGSIAETVFRNGFSIPHAVDAVAFVAAISASAALVSSLRKRLREKIGQSVASFALVAALALFFTNVFELRSCQISWVEDYECYWIVDALAWSTSIMLGLLALKAGMENSEKGRRQGQIVDNSDFPP